MSGDDLRLEAVQDDEGLRVRRVDLAPDPVEHVLERCVVHQRRRRDVRAEETYVETAKAAERPETLALTARNSDRCSPVRPHTQLAGAQPPDPASGAERDRNVLQRAPFARQQPLRGAGRHPPDVDAGDANAVGEARR
jgi:hypothetical protein